jgi:hypothetical protein
MPYSAGLACGRSCQNQTYAFAYTVYLRVTIASSIECGHTEHLYYIDVNYLDLERSAEYIGTLPFGTHNTGYEVKMFSVKPGVRGC